MVKILRVLLVLLSLSFPAGASEPVAIVYSLAGEASLEAPGAARRPLRLFDRLPGGAVVEVGAGSRVALAFVNGRRYELGEHSRVRLGSKDLSSRTGGVLALSPVPPLPHLLPIAAKDRPGARAGAVRIRTEEMRLFPRGDAVTLADAARLHFEGSNGAARYRVEIEDVRGTVVFSTVTATSPVSVPAGILAPGARYHWSAKALDRPGPVVRGEADFVTLSRKAARSRERIREALGPGDDDDSRALLAAVDHVLGLADEDPEAAGGTIRAAPD